LRRERQPRINQKLFAALIFAVHDCGFIARCALEIDDSGEFRLSKILKLIAQCGFGEILLRSQRSRAALPPVATVDSAP
jgi:hypothetical protein